MKRISIDNGTNYIAPAQFLKLYDLDDVADMMDEETRDYVSMLYAPCSQLKFLREYLKRSPYDLILG